MAEGGPPDLEIQKKQFQEYLKQSLKKGESWYLIAVGWFKKWKKYVGYDTWDAFNVGEQDYNPGVIDNGDLFKPDSKELKEHLVDDLDYVLLPEEAFNKLTSWYGVKEGQDAIVRKVIEQGMYVKHCKVEVYLMELKLSENSDLSTQQSFSFSRADTVSTIETEMRRIFSVPEGKEVRLWNRYMSNTYEHLSKKDITLQDAGLYAGQVIVIELQNEDGTWPRQAKSASAYSSAAYPSTRNAGTSGVSNGSSTSTYDSGQGSSSSSYYGSSNGYDRGGGSKPGLCGLSNLGNTCFMNSALQCMSNVPALTEYMMSSRWEKELNKDNPLGMRGEIAVSYNELIRDVWSGDRSYTVPRNFKVAVGRFAPQFSGYQQQDSQELLAFLLDGLHEDLNRIRKKPYIELKDSGGRPDQEVAMEAWTNYKKRNDSVIVDTFHGLLKSRVKCPDCNKISVTFDPFCYLSLPLPVKKERLMEVIWVPLPPDKKPVQLKVTVPNVGCIKDLCKAVQNYVNVEPEQMKVTDVYNRRFHKIFTPDEGVNHILDRDDIFIFQIPVEDENTAILPIYLREKKYRLRQSDQNSVSSQPLFGFPFMLAVPKKSCTYQMLYQLLMDRMARYVEQPDTNDNWHEDEEEEDMDDSRDDSSTSSNGALAVGDSTDSEIEMASVSGAGVPDAVESLTDSSNNMGDDRETGENLNSVPSNKRIFSLKVANSFGRDEVGPKLVDNGKPLKLEKKPYTYIAVDWSCKAKDKFFNTKTAEDFEEHESMRSRNALKRSTLQLEDCLQLFMKEEQLSKHDPWYCPVCKEHRQAMKKFDIWSLPDVLIIHLKRFSYNKYWRDKLDALIQFPTRDLDLEGITKGKIKEDDSFVYDLIAVTNHYGGLGGGHYTAYGLNKDDDSWYYFDDSSVSSSNEESVCTKAAYVLVYKKKSRSGSKKSSTASSTATISLAHSMTNGNGSTADCEEMETN